MEGLGAQGGEGQLQAEAAAETRGDGLETAEVGGISDDEGRAKEANGTCDVIPESQCYLFLRVEPFGQAKAKTHGYMPIFEAESHLKRRKRPFALHLDDLPASVLLSLFFWTFLPLIGSVGILLSSLSNSGDNAGLFEAASAVTVSLQAVALFAQVMCFCLPLRSTADKCFAWLGLFSGALAMAVISGLSFASMNDLEGSRLAPIFRQLLNVVIGAFFCVPAFVRRSLPRGFTRTEAESLPDLRGVRAVADGFEWKKKVSGPPGCEDTQGGGDGVVKETPEASGVRWGVDLEGQTGKKERLVFGQSETYEVNRVWWHFPLESSNNGAGEGGEQKEGDGDEDKGEKKGKCGSFCRFCSHVGLVLGCIGGALKDSCLCWWTTWVCCRPPVVAAPSLDFRRLLLGALVCLVFFDFSSDVAVGVQLTLASLYRWTDYGRPEPPRTSMWGVQEFHLFGPRYGNNSLNPVNFVRPVFVNGILQSYDGINEWDDRYHQALQEGLFFNVSVPPFLLEA